MDPTFYVHVGALELTIVSGVIVVTVWVMMRFEKLGSHIGAKIDAVKADVAEIHTDVGRTEEKVHAIRETVERHEREIDRLQSMPRSVVQNPAGCR